MFEQEVTPNGPASDPRDHSNYHRGQHDQRSSLTSTARPRAEKNPTPIGDTRMRTPWEEEPAVVEGRQQPRSPRPPSVMASRSPWLAGHEEKNTQAAPKGPSSSQRTTPNPTPTSTSDRQLPAPKEGARYTRAPTKPATTRSSANA